MSKSMMEDMIEKLPHKRVETSTSHYDNHRTLTYSGCPVGNIHRIEGKQAEVEFIRRQEDIRFVMLNIDSAKNMLSAGMDASHFGPRVRVITTSTIHDNRLPYFYTAKEAEVVRNFGPTWHVPCDRPIYSLQEPKERLWYLKNQIESTIEMKHLLAGTETRMIPLLKWITPDELLLCYDSLVRHEFEEFSYYSVQYFGRSRGNNRRQLIADVRQMITLLEIDYLLLIGLQSEALIRYLPKQVRAYASLNLVREEFWRQKSSESSSGGRALSKGRMPHIHNSRLEVLNSQWKGKDW